MEESDGVTPRRAVSRCAITGRVNTRKEITRVNKKEVAEFLGVSPRAVNRYAEAGRLTVTYRRRQGGGNEGVYDRAEVEALKRDMETEQQSPRSPQEVKTLEPLSAVREIVTSPKYREAIAALSAVLPRPDVLTGDDAGTASARDVATLEELRQRAVLTFDEAARVTGLGRGTIERLVAEGKVGSQRWGPNGARVVSRAALERAIVESLG
jgi:excisionase family DNA binding protein